VRSFDARTTWRETVRKARHLTGAVRLVGLALADAVGADGIGEVGVYDLAEDCGLSVSTVKRALSQLCAEELAHRDYRGHNTPAGAYVSTWRLSTSTRPVVGASTAHADTLSPSSTAQRERLSRLSTAHADTLNGLNSSRRPLEPGSTAQNEPSLLGQGDEDEESSSSLGVSLTRGGDASRAAPPLTELPTQAQVHEVFRWIPDVVRAQTGTLVRKQKLLIAQRLAAGCSVEQLVADGQAAAAEARAMAVRGDPVRNAVGFWASQVREEPDDLVVDVRDEEPPAAAPEPWDGLEWCGVCDGVDRTVEDSLGRLAPCPECNPKAVRRQFAAHMARSS
jgi:hypothetical protein